MLREGLAFFSYTYLTVIAMLLFLGTFVGVVLWTFRKSARKHYEEMAEMPLDERTSR